MSIIPDPARSSRFSLHGLGTLLLPQAPQRGFKHRNRNTALISPSKPTFERHSRCTAESEWEDLGDTDRALDEVKTKARLAAWTTLTSGVAPHVVPGDVSALSVLKQARRETGRRTCQSNQPRWHSSYRKHIRPRLRASTSTLFLLSPLIWILPSPQWPIDSRLGMGRVPIWRIALFNRPRSWLIGVKRL
jgi:hypothetical protein